MYLYRCNTDARNKWECIIVKFSLLPMMMMTPQAVFTQYECDSQFFNDIGRWAS